MSQRYIPPSLRARTNSTTQGELSPSKASEGLQRRRLADLALTDDGVYALREIYNHYGVLSAAGHTLHDSADNPRQLAFIVLFHNANPRWNSNGIIFAHSHIDLLPGYDEFKLSLDKEIHAQENSITASESSTEAAVDVETSVSTIQVPGSKTEELQGTGGVPHGVAAHEPATPSITLSYKISIFTEAPGKRSRRFTFHGYFNLDNIDFLAPRSPEVVRMLQQKWEPANDHPNKPAFNARKRESAAWKKSLEQEWAVLKLSRVPDNELEVLKVPVIELLPDQEIENVERTGRKDRSFAKRFGAEED